MASPRFQDWLWKMGVLIKFFHVATASIILFNYRDQSPIRAIALHPRLPFIAIGRQVSESSVCVSACVHVYSLYGRSIV